MNKISTRIILVIVVAAVYLLVWRPLRVTINVNVIQPVSESIIEGSEDRFQTRPTSKPISFHLDVLDSETGRRQNTFVFGTPWGFYLVFPLIVLLLLDRGWFFINLHLGVQFVVGFVAILLFWGGLAGFVSLLHITKMLVMYVNPGFGLMLVMLLAIRRFKGEDKIIGEQSGG